MIENTKAISYEDFKNTGNLESQEEAVHKIVILYPNSTAEEIADFLNIKRTSVDGRLHELMDKGMIVEDKPKVNQSSGKLNKTYRAVRKGEQSSQEPILTMLSSTEMNKMVSMWYRANPRQREIIKGWFV